jgi:hypothetical protein
MRVGSTVTWHWGQGTAEGKIKEVFQEEVTRTIKGAHIKRKGSKEDPAYLIEQADGDRVLKLKSELTPK